MTAAARRVLIETPITITRHASGQGQAWAGAPKSMALPQDGRRVPKRHVEGSVDIDEWRARLYEGGEEA